MCVLCDKPIKPLSHTHTHSDENDSILIPLHFTLQVPFATLLTQLHQPAPVLRCTRKNPGPGLGKTFCVMQAGAWMNLCHYYRAGPKTWPQNCIGPVSSPRTPPVDKRASPCRYGYETDTRLRSLGRLSFVLCCRPSVALHALRCGDCGEYFASFLACRRRVKAIFQPTKRS